MAEMRNEMKMAPPVETMEDVSEREAKLLAEVQKLLDQRDKLQKMYDTVNEMNKALRHKSGQVFISALGDGLKLGSGVAKGNEKANLEDEEAVVRMLKKIDQEKTVHGDLRNRLKKCGF
jgi:tRNA(Glu) U13 pseudouridine synthase TruD